MAAMALNLAGLGKSVLQPSGMVANLNPTVRVRRKDTTVEITTLMEEHMRQLDEDFPNFLQEFIRLPQSYEFDDRILHNIQGFPDHMKPTIPAEFAWMKAATGFSGELLLFKMMCRSFSGSRGSLMISGLKTEQLFTIARQTLDHEYKKWKEENPTKLAGQLTAGEKKFYSTILDIPIGDFQSEVNKFTADI